MLANMAGGSLYIVPNHSVTSVLTTTCVVTTTADVISYPPSRTLLPIVVTQPLPSPPPPTVVIPGSLHSNDVTQPPPRASLTTGNLVLQATLPGVKRPCMASVFLGKCAPLPRRSNPAEEIGFLEVCVNPK